MGSDLIRTFFLPVSVSESASQSESAFCDTLTQERNAESKRLLERMVAMLTKLEMRVATLALGPCPDFSGMDNIDPDTEMNEGTSFMEFPPRCAPV